MQHCPELLCVVMLQAERTARDMAAVAAAIEQRCASLEVALQEQGETYETEIACLTTEVEQVSTTVIMIPCARRSEN